MSHMNPNEFWATPKSADEMESFIKAQPEEQQWALYHIMMLTWNYACNISNKGLNADGITPKDARDKYIFTFGTSHLHPETGDNLGHHYVEIIAKDPDEAREIMFKYFGNRWSMQYYSAEEAGVVKHGLRKTYLPEKPFDKNS